MDSISAFARGQSIAMWLFKQTLLFLSGVSILFTMNATAAPDLSGIQLPAGFKISLFAEVPNARSLAVSPGGHVYAGNRNGDSVYRIKNGKTERFAMGLKTPNGVAFKGKDLYVAEVNRIMVFENADDMKISAKPTKTIPVKLPNDASHGWKFIRFGPDGELYVPVGAPCNICDEPGDYAKILRVNVQTGAKTIIAQGVRNTVGFDWHPQTKELWFTENGRDWLGDDQPPDEVNRVTKEGAHYGYPYCHGQNIIDPEFGKDKKCSDYVPPVVELRAHVAALGMRFYTGTMFPEKYRGAIFIAEHGSWNRSNPQGYRLTVVTMKGSEVLATEGFAEGFLRARKVKGRPVDVEQMPDGSLLVSDDYTGAIYRITYSK